MSNRYIKRRPKDRETITMKEVEDAMKSLIIQICKKNGVESSPEMIRAISELRHSLAGY